MTEQNNPQPGSNPRMWQGREIRNDMPVGRQYDILPKVDADTSLKQFSRELEVRFPSVEQMKREVETGEFSPESIAVANSILADAENIEDAVDSYIDTAAVRKDSLYDADQDSSDWWARQEHFGAAIYDERAQGLHEQIIDAQLAKADDIITRMRNYSDLSDEERQALRAQETYKRDRSRAWREEATTRITMNVKSASAHFKKIGTETKKTTKAFKQIAKVAPKKPEPGANLTHRPFLILSTIRDEFTEK